MLYHSRLDVLMLCYIIDARSTRQTRESSETLLENSYAHVRARPRPGPKGGNIVQHNITQYNMT